MLPSCRKSPFMFTSVLNAPVLGGEREEGAPRRQSQQRGPGRPPGAHQSRACAGPAALLTPTCKLTSPPAHGLQPQTGPSPRGSGSPTPARPAHAPGGGESGVFVLQVGVLGGVGGFTHGLSGPLSSAGSREGHQAPWGPH